MDMARAEDLCGDGVKKKEAACEFRCVFALQQRIYVLKKKRMRPVLGVTAWSRSGKS
jgi:hypothetical protein